MMAQKTMIAKRFWASVIAPAPMAYPRRPSTYARLRPMRSPTLLPIRMNAAETSASSAIADWTPLTVVSRSRTTDAIDTFISEVSTTSTNIAIASRMARRRFLDAASGTAGLPRSVIAPRSGAEDPALLRRELLLAQHALGLQLAELPELGKLGIHVVSGRGWGSVIGLLLLGGPPVALPPRHAVGHGRRRPGDHGRPRDPTK